MEHTLARQAAAIERVVSSNSANLQRAVEELANRSSSGSDALSGQARVLKEVSATLMNQLGGLTKRFEEQGAALINASRTFEVSNTKVDAMMEQRQAGFNKLMENIGARAAELDRMMNSYSNMLEQSLSQAELRARKVTELLAKDSAEKSQVAIREIERLRQDAQVHTQKAVTELQANFSSLSDQVSNQLTNLSSKFSDTTRVVRDSTRRAASDLGIGSNRASASRKGAAGNGKAKRHCHAPGVAGSAFRARCVVRSFQPSRLLKRGLGPRAKKRAAAARARNPSRRSLRTMLHSLPNAPPSTTASRQLEKPGWLQSEPQQPPRPFQPEAQLPPMQPPPPFQESQPAERRNQWSLGDLLARASEDDSHFPEKDEFIRTTAAYASLRLEGRRRTGAAAATPPAWISP